MTPAARLAMAIGVMDAILEAVRANGPAADTLLARTFAGARYAGSGDRAAVRRLIYDWLRNAQALLAGAPEPTGRGVALAAQPDAATARTLFTGERHAPATLTPEEALWLERPGVALSQPARVNLPANLAPFFERRFGTDWATASLALNQRAPLDLRVNGARDAMQKQLAAEGIETAPTPHSPWGLRVVGEANVERTQVWREGLIEVQDEASQLVALACAVRPGERVLDLCAGAGGKTLALAMGNPAVLVAHDRDARRLARLEPRARRAGVDVILSHDDPTGLSSRWPDGFDCVLVDAPCTGTGTWRRNPEGRLRVTPASIAEAQAIQIQLVNAGLDLLRPGGRLIYAVCSVLVEEGGDVIADVLARRSDVTATALAVPGLCDANASSGGNSLSIAPHSHDMDGFFIARFSRLC